MHHPKIYFAKKHPKKVSGKSAALFSFAIFMASSKVRKVNKFSDFQVPFPLHKHLFQPIMSGLKCKKYVAFRKTQIFPF